MSEAALEPTGGSRPNARTVLRRVAMGAAALFAVGALGHAPFARAWLAKLGGCPMGAPLSAAELEARRVEAVKKIAGTTDARSRPAFGFALERSTRGDARAWAAEHGGGCEDEPGGAALRCKATDGTDVFFQYGPRGDLVALDVMREGVSPARAAELVKAEIALLTREAGPPARALGETDAAYLAGPLRQVNAEFRFRDYAADVTASNLGEGVLVRMQYRSIPKGPPEG